jgi:hypothetical protein
MNLHFNLQTAGVLQILLAAAHLTFSKRFNWKEELARISLLNRQIFYVHTFFICLVLVLFGLLCVVCWEVLLGPVRLARAVVAGIGAFWFIRLIFQFFIYDSQLWRGNRFNTCAHVFFVLLWAYFAGTYCVIFLHQMGK